MTRTFLLVLVCLLSTLARSSSGGLTDTRIVCTLTGEVADRKDGNLFLYRPESSQFDKDTIAFKDHVFTYTVTISAPEVYWLFFEEDEKDGNGFTPIKIFLEEGTVHVKLAIANIHSYQVSGGELNKLLISEEKKSNDIFRRMGYNKGRIETSSDPEEIKRLSAKNDSLKKEVRGIPLTYIAHHVDLIAAFYLWQLRRSVSLDRIKQMLEPFRQPFAHHRYISEVVAYIDGADKNRKGELFTDFKLLHTTGEEVLISDIVKNHQLTLITFWSSRCHASDRKLNSFKDLYNTFKPKGFQIIGISDDLMIARWKNAIARNDATWVNLLDYDGEKAVDEYYHALEYGDLLVDRNGKIISRGINGLQLAEHLNRMIE